MSTVSNFLRQKADELRITPESVAVQTLVKEAGLSEEDARMAVAQDLMEKEAVRGLAQKGVNIEEAVKLVKAAGIDVKSLSSVKFELEENPVAELLDKAAAYIEQLEGYVSVLETETNDLQANLEKVASQQSQAEVEDLKEQLPGNFKKMASVGAFTSKDLETLVAVQKENPELIQKIAVAAEEPWSLGGPVGMAVQETDPFLEFLMA